MGDRVGDFLEFLIMLVVLVAFIMFGMFTFNTSNKFNRYAQEQLSKEIVSLENAKLDAYNGKIISGREAKNLMIEYSGKDCAFLVSTIALNKAANGGMQMYGTLVDDMKKNKVPGTNLYDISMNINKGKTVTGANLYALNFGSVLTVCTKPVSDATGAYISVLKADTNGVLVKDEAIDAYGRTNNTGYKQGIKFDSDGGSFIATGTLATNSKDANQDMRYDKLHDLDVEGATMYMPDMAQFYSYLIKSVNGDIMGFAFIQVAATDVI